MEEKEKLEPIISPGSIKIHKKSFAEKMKDAFLAEGFASASSSVMNNVMIPTVKKFIAETINGIVNGMLFGTSQPTTGGIKIGSTWSWGGFNYSTPLINYSGISTQSSQVPSQPSIVGNFNDFEIIPDPSNGEDMKYAKMKADLVLDTLKDELDRYGKVSINSLYELVGKPTYAPFYNYGWTNLKDATVMYNGRGFIFKLPEPIPIK